MRIRRIELTNIRHFAGRRVSLSGIGDGLTVLAQPNEFGKSTFFDALHALFFEKHRSTKAAVKALQPHAGGAPEVAVEVDLPQGRFVISKRWLARARACVTDAGGRVAALDDEAEAWIADLLGAGLAGPSGLLWVRQGVLGLEPHGGGTDERRERERGLAARRDLMSSVAGEIERMTGGRRMDSVIDRTAEGLAQLATATGKPKAQGAWAEALAEATTLAARETELRDRMGRLGGDLQRRAEVLRQQAVLTDPHAVQAREAALIAAREAHQVARAHADRLHEARRSVTLADLTAKATQAEITRLERLATRVRATVQAHQDATVTAGAARRHAEDRGAHNAHATAAAARATEVVVDLRRRLAAAQKARLAAAAQRRALDLSRDLDRAVALQQRQQHDQAQRARITVTSQSLAAAELAQGAVDRLMAQAEAQAVTLRFSYSGGLRASIDGVAVDDSLHKLRVPTDVLLPGIGRLHVDPGAGRGGDLTADLAKARMALAGHLAACGAADLTEARRHLAAAGRSQDALEATGLALAELAPDGIDAMRQAQATALAEAAETCGIDADPADLERRLAAAETAEAEAAGCARTAHALAAEATETRVRAEADLRSAERLMTEASGDAGDPDAAERALAGLRAALTDQLAHCVEADRAVGQLGAEAPDLETAAAGLARATSAMDQARRAVDELREELVSLNTRIELLAEQGIEETLNEISAARSAAEARALRYDGEVQALTRLRRALEEARSQARDTYFAPVMRELEPLLAMLHPDATIRIDDQTLLPVALTRAGQSEALDILSGGTREQLAILTRLAFARLFAKSGRSVPVILDDALVHSDDDRIEAMFTAFHRIARDQQVLVLTCRQRAFASLGGDRARVEVTPL